MPRPSNHVVFVHGLWVTAASWAGFRSAFEAAGYTTHAPEWKVFEGRSAPDIRAKVPADLPAQTLGMITDQMQAHIETLPESPLIVGHSFGGLFTQLLLDRGLGVAGAAIDPAPIAGVVPGPVALGGALPVLAKGWNRPFAMTREQFHARFANTAPKDFVYDFWEKYHVPSPSRLTWQAAFWIGNFVNPRRRRQPLLITGADKDRLVSPYLSRAAARVQRLSPARTDLVMFSNRSHLLCAEPGWEEVAGAVIDWADRL
jgi:pimeloyl-ACP methyl ester carboxylesterase